MLVITIALTFLLAVGFYFYTKPSLIEKQIKEQGGNFPCFKCKKEIFMDQNNCQHCEFVTYFGITRKKRKKFFYVLILYIFAMANIWRKNMGLF